MKRSLLLLVAATASVAALPASPASAAETELRAVGCFPLGSPPSREFEAYVKAVNARSKGVLQIKILGGAPAIGSPFTLTQRMAKGAYDLVSCTEGYFGNVFPEAPVLRLSDYSFAELRKKGAIAYVQKLLAAKNLYFVARIQYDGPFHLWLSKKITKPDLTGLHLRVAPIYTAFFKSLGATTQRAAMPQIFTLMENNTVQGYGWPALGWVPSWAKVTKYRVEPGFYHAGLHLLVNLKKWRSLSSPQRALIAKVGREFEAREEPPSARYSDRWKKRMAMLASLGIEVIEFKGADRKKWLATATKAAWDEVVKRSPVHGPRLKKMFTRQ